jgi:hypothetical protein
MQSAGGKPDRPARGSENRNGPEALALELAEVFEALSLKNALAGTAMASASDPAARSDASAFLRRTRPTSLSRFAQPVAGEAAQLPSLLRQDLDRLQEARAYQRLIDALHSPQGRSRAPRRRPEVRRRPPEGARARAAAQGGIRRDPAGRGQGARSAGQAGPRAAGDRRRPGSKRSRPTNGTSRPAGRTSRVTRSACCWATPEARRPTCLQASTRVAPLAGRQLHNRRRGEHPAQKLGKLLGQEPGGVAIRFDGEELEQAEALDAPPLRPGLRGPGRGQDVAGQLTGDSIERAHLPAGLPTDRQRPE